MVSDSEQLSGQALAWWTTGPGQGSLLPSAIDSASLDSKEPIVTIEALYSGVSRGTEALVFQGRIPETEYERMRAPFQQGDFPFPVKYGYANVGRVVDGPADLQGRLVFCLYPHQQRFQVPAAAVTEIPDAVPAARAVLAANMETAINGLWDGAPAIGDRIAVVGLGVVGLLVAWLANQIPGAEVTAIDVNQDRKAVAEALGLRFSTTPTGDDHDVVFHTSGHPSGLATALSLAGQESVIVEMSWYGDQPVSAALGGAFHSRRLTLRSSQVGQIPSFRLPRWDYGRRMRLALQLLADDRLDHLISGETPFVDLPAAMASILTEGSQTLCHRVVY